MKNLFKYPQVADRLVEEIKISLGKQRDTVAAKSISTFEFFNFSAMETFENG